MHRTQQKNSAGVAPPAESLPIIGLRDSKVRCTDMCSAVAGSSAATVDHEARWRQTLARGGQPPIFFVSAQHAIVRPTHPPIELHPWLWQLASARHGPPISGAGLALW